MLSFGEYLVLHRRVTAQAVLQVLKKQARSRPHVGELAARRSWMTWAQVLGVLSLCDQKGGRFGDVAVSQGILTRDQLDQLLAEQRAATPRLEDCILDLGLMEWEQIEEEKARYLAEIGSLTSG